MTDWTDWTVYTNLAYPCAAIPLWGEWVAFAVLLASGLALGYASAWYHATGLRMAQRADVTMVMTYVAAGAAVYASSWSMLVYALPLIVPWVYWRHAWQIEAQVHAPAWIIGALTILTVQTGTWAIGAWVLALSAGAMKYISGHNDSVWHDLWHVLAAGAQAYGAWLI